MNLKSKKLLTLHAGMILVLLLTSCTQAVISPDLSLSTSIPASTDSMLGEPPTITAHLPTSTSVPIAPSVSSPPTATLEPTQIPSRVGPEDYPEGVNPLTGLRVSDPALLERRPVMVKVSNYPAYLRPHSGLSNADLVWEYYIGVGMTRFLALYYGENAPQVGPVRSGR
ncbi:MAG: DUF3048 domain-containing protein, partial [Anaerolineales bacterium]